MKLTFANYRRPFSTDPGKWSASDIAQAEAICETEGWEDDLAAYRDSPDTAAEALEEWELLGAEVVDVVDADGGTVYQIWFFDFGTAYMYQANTTDEVGGASQHGFELNDPSDELYDAIAAAYRGAKPKIDQVMDF